MHVHASIAAMADFRPVISAFSYVWRLAGTALSFTLFGLGGLVIGCCVIPLIALVVRDRDRRTRVTRALIGSAMRTFVGFMSVVGVLSYRIEGLEHVRDNQNYLILANHPSLIDVIFLVAWFPQAVCVVKQDIFDNPFTGQVVRLAGYLSNADPALMLNHAIEQLLKGKSLILFPEGTRTSPGQALAFRQAAAAIAVRANALCLPVIIRVEPTTLTKAEPWYRIPARRVYFHMSIQCPLQPMDHLDPQQDSRRPDRAFNRFLHTYFTKHLELHSRGCQ